MAIDKTKLTGVEKVYPLNVPPYEQYMGDFQNPSVVSKVNAMIQSLHQIGRLTNETVSQWNNVMKWIVGGGMDEIAETITNEKVSVALDEVMRMLDVSLDNGLKELAENVSDKKIDELLESGQFEGMIETSLVGINKEVNDKLLEFDNEIMLNQKFYNQTDFVEVLRQHNDTSSAMKSRILGDRHFEVLIPIKGNTLSHFSFKKDVMDDYVKFGSGGISVMKEVPAVSEKQIINRETQTGTWGYTAEPNIFTTTVGATFTFTFKGIGFDFHSYMDNRGGVWEFVVDGNPELTKRISTWRETSSENDGTFVVFRGLLNENHTVIATFIGDDPLHPPSTGTGTSRGWAASPRHFDGTERLSRYPIIIYQTKNNPISVVDFLVESSNKEFAIFVKPTDTTENAQFIPEHSGVGTVFAKRQKIYFDDKEITDWSTQTNLYDVRSIRIVQEMQAFHPSDKINPIANIFSLHTVTSKGVSYDVEIEWLKDCTSTSGYVNMFPFYIRSADYLISSIGNRYDVMTASEFGADRVDLDKNEEHTVSFAVVNENSTELLNRSVCAMTTHNVESAFRHDKLNKRDPLMWLQYRDGDSMNKLYPHVYSKPDIIIEKGERHKIGATFYIGEMEMASKLLK